MAGTIIDMHIHTLRGAADSSLKPEQLVEVARRIGLTGVNITEHDRRWDVVDEERFRQESGLFVSCAMEVSTDMGHMIVIGLDRYVPGIRRLEELRQVADAMGAFVIVAHPFRHFFDPVHFRRDGREPFSMTPEEAARLPVFSLVDEIEVANGGNNLRENYFALLVARVLGKRGVGSSDAHSTSGVGIYCTVFEKELTSQRQMIEELRAGRFHPAMGLPEGRLRPFTDDTVAELDRTLVPLH